MDPKNLKEADKVFKIAKEAYILLYYSVKNHNRYNEMV